VICKARNAGSRSVPGGLRYLPVWWRAHETWVESAGVKRPKIYPSGREGSGPAADHSRMRMVGVSSAFAQSAFTDIDVGMAARVASPSATGSTQSVALHESTRFPPAYVRYRTDAEREHFQNRPREG
jgi:hypothetical protein